MNTRSAAAALALAFSGCGPGMLDYSDQIGSTKYDFVRTDGRSHWIFPQSRCGAKCPGIPRNVVKLRWNDRAIAVRRQVVQNFRCDDRTLVSQYINLYQQYVIVLKSNELVGPLSVAEYVKFSAANPTLLEGINLLEVDDLHDGTGEVEEGLGSCENAKPA